MSGCLGRCPKEKSCLLLNSVPVYTRPLLKCVRDKADSKEKFIVDEITLAFASFLNAIFVNKSEFNNTDVTGEGHSSYILFTAKIRVCLETSKTGT